METLDGDAIARWLERAADVLEQEKAYLTDLDAPIGDSDHGVNMARGFTALRLKLGACPRDDIGALLKTAGMTLLSTVGGASGPLYGTFFLDSAKVAAGRASLDLSAFVDCLAAGLEGVKRRGKAEAGDKTMVDALLPAIEKARETLEKGEPLAASLSAIADAAKEGAAATIPLLARKGRASYLGERSVGHQDPGATSTFFLLRTLAEVASA